MLPTLRLVAFLGLDLLLFALAPVSAQTATGPVMPTFYARRDYGVPGNSQVQVADVNGDKIPDLIINGSGSIDVMLGNGDGTFHAGPSSKTALFQNVNFALADVNGDGKLDLITSGATFVGSEIEAGVTVNFGNGDGSFQAGTLYQIGPLSFNTVTINGAIVGDFNSDGILDIVTVGQGGVWVLTGQGGARLTKA
jgi:hypothetical protein